MQIISRKEAKAQGLQFYFTGKKCKHGHISERYTGTKICRQCCINVSRERRERNPEEVARNNHKTYYKDVEASKRRVREYHHKNREYRIKKCKEWKENNKERCRLYVSRRRRLISKGADSYQKINDWLQKQEKICFYCGEDCSDEFEIDHVTPLSKGGRHIVKNLAIACVHCNRSKYNKTLAEWRAQWPT